MAVDFAREAMRAIFGSRIDKHFKGGTLTGWGADPLTRGSYADARPGQALARGPLRRPIADRLFFAGEACAGAWAATCAGAYLSGVAVAKRLAKTLG